MSKYYFFNSSVEAEKFIKENNIKDYKFQAPILFGYGVLVVQDTFVCEICGEKTPVDCEGSEPNTCAECMPIKPTNIKGVCDYDW